MGSEQWVRATCLSKDVSYVGGPSDGSERQIPSDWVREMGFEKRAVPGWKREPASAEPMCTEPLSAMAMSAMATSAMAASAIWWQACGLVTPANVK